MKMTDDAVEGGAKESASPPKKKLKQARLPFQILSPADKPVEIKPRKRKASSSSDDVQIVEVDLDVKENQSVVPDKKLRLEHKEETKQKIPQEKQNVAKKNVSEKNNSVKVDKSGDKKLSKIVIDPVIEIIDDSADGELNNADNIEGNIDLNVVKNNVQSDKSKQIGEFKKDDVTTPLDVVKDAENEQEVENLEESKTSLGDDTTLMSCESGTDSETDKDNSMTSDKSPNVTSSTKKSVKTPKTTSKTSPESGTPKIRKLTPKQLLLRKEREKAREEKERLKEEREKKRAEEREERQKLKNEKEDAKKREREEKEKKRLAEIEAKNEEKRVKEEEKKAKEEERKKKEEAKEEERKKKDEERKQKEEEKRLKEEAKHAEHRKSAAVFVNFFVTKKVDSKSQGPDKNVEVLPEAEKFMPFEVKGDMRLAPLVRKEFFEENKQILDCALKDQSNTSECLYVQSLRGGKYVPAASGKTWPYVVDEDDDIIIVEAENPEQGTEKVNEEKEEKKCTRRQRAKLIQFYDNRRPPYWGTWRKKSREIRPRAPFNMDKTMLEYEVDSDDEWEEIEDGESLRGSDDDESQDENYEEDNDMFVPHGYLSDEEGQDEMEDTSPEAQKAKLKLLQLEFEAERSEKQERQKPRLIGCVWFQNNVDDPDKVGSQIAELFLLRRAVWEGELPISLKMETTDCKEESPSLENSVGPKKNRSVNIPESAIPKMISLIHGNQHNRKFLSNELYQYFLNEKLTPKPSRNSIFNKLRELATWTVCPEEEGPPLAKRKCWYVSADVREAYGLKELQACQSLTWKYSLTPPDTPKKVDQSMEVSEAPLPLTPSHFSSIKKFTKVLSKEERQKQLLSNNTESTSPATSTTNIKQILPKIKKRVSLLSVPPGQDLPKQNKTRPLDNFLKIKKPLDQQNKAEEKQPPKPPKRITPISIPRKAPAVEDCVVLSD